MAEGIAVLPLHSPRLGKGPAKGTRSIRSERRPHSAPAWYTMGVAGSIKSDLIYGLGKKLEERVESRHDARSDEAVNTAVEKEIKALQTQLDQAVWGLERQQARRRTLVLKRERTKHSIELADLARRRGAHERAVLSRVEDSHAADCAVELRDAAAAAEIQLAAALAALTRRLTGTITGTMTVQRELAVQRAVERARQRHAAQVVRAERELLVPQATKMAEIADAHLQRVDILSAETDAAVELAAELVPKVEELSRRLADLARRNGTLERSSVLAGLAGRAPVEFPDPHADQRAGRWQDRQRPERVVGVWSPREAPGS